MPLINTSIPNLIQGVSQQPSATRFTGQCEEQENALSSVVDGLKKRPNTRHIATLLTEAISNKSFIHFINRSDEERYVVIHDGTKIQIFNLEDGEEAQINEQFGGYTPSDSSYLYTTNPRKELKSLTVADNTFLLNTEKIVKKLPEKTPELEKEAIVFVAQGDYQKEYEVNFSTGNEAILSVILNEYVRNSRGYWEYNGVITYTTGTEFERPSGYYYYTLPTDRTATIINAGSGYKPNKTFSDNYIITFTAVYETGLTSDYLNVRVETDADGKITQGLFLSLGGTLITDPVYFKPPAPDGEEFGNLGRIIFKSGPSSNGLNADTRQIAFGLGFDSRETSDGARTDQTTVGIISTNKLDNPIVEGSVIKYKRADGTDFKITTTDGLGDSGLGVAHKQVTSISNLPIRNFNNFKVKIIGDDEIQQDDYYVQFQTDDGGAFGSGYYKEITEFNSQYRLDNTTLPFRLISTGVNTFSLSESNYNPRIAGDNNSNPFPSFVDSKISNLFFFKNRLGFLSEGNVVLSEAGEFFNFFRITTQSLLDSAPIDISVASNRVTNFKAAAGFQENLILFSENGQFVLKGGDLLTPKTISITPVTNFDVDPDVDPLALGSYLYFPFNRGRFTGFREYSVNSTTDNYDSSDITEQVPNYIPANINSISGTTTEDIIVVTTDNDPSSLFVYKYFWSGVNKVLSSWSKFTLQGNIIGMSFIEADLYILITLNNQTHLVLLPFDSSALDDAGFTTHLDMRSFHTVTAGSDIISIPYNVISENNLQVWTKDGAFLKSTSYANSVQLSEPVDEDTEVWVGLPYTMKYTFSEQLFKLPSGQTQTPSNINQIKIKNLNLFFDKTAAFDVKVTPKFRDTFVSSFTPTVVGSSTIGTLTLDSGAFRVPIFTKAEDTTITIESDSALPCSFQSAEFESFIHSRSNRIA